MNESKIAGIVKGINVNVNLELWLFNLKEKLHSNDSGAWYKPKLTKADVSQRRNLAGGRTEENFTSLTPEKPQNFKRNW